MNVNTWLNLVGASMMAAGGLASNAVVYIVAAMLVSPIMGPILGKPNTPTQTLSLTLT